MAAVSGAKSFKYLLVTGVLAKAVQPNVHPRAIQVGSSLPGAYDARSLCHKVIVPFEKTRGNLFGMSDEPFVNKPLRHPEHDKSNPQLRNGKISAIMHDSLEMVRVVPEGEVYAALVHILRLGKQRADLTKAVSMAGEQDLAVSTKFVSEFLGRADGGARLVALWAAMLRLSDEESDVRAHNPNQSDEYSGTIGDVEVFMEGELLSASECKHRPISLDDIEHGLAKNKVGAEYIFVIAAGFQENQETAVRNRIVEAASQADVSLIEAEHDFVTMLKMMGPHRRKRLGSTVASVLKEMREFNCADEAGTIWNKLLEK